MINTILKKDRSVSISFLLWLFRISVVGLLGWMVYNQVLLNKDLSEIIVNFKKVMRSNNRLWAFIVCSILMVFNWLIESKKWQTLINSIIEFKFQNAIEGVLMGIAAGIITPSRIGEYGGRILNLPTNYRKIGLHANFVSSISQNLANIFFGIVGGSYFILLYLDWSKYITWSLLVGGITLFSLLMLIFYGHKKLLLILVDRMPDRITLWARRIVEGLPAIDNGTLNKILMYSFIRYIVFGIQYALLLYFFGVNIPIIAIITGISLIFLIQSGIPLPPFLSMLARGEIAIIIWSIFTIDVLTILSATFSLWLINLLLPAIIGGIVMIYKPLIR